MFIATAMRSRMYILHTNILELYTVQTLFYFHMLSD